MKKLSISLAVIAAAALTLVSCTKEITQDTPSADGIDVTIVAGSPVTKTALGSDGKTPFWRDGDALSVTNGTSSNVSFAENSIADGETALIATFSGKVTEAGDYYAVYPHTGSITNSKGPRVTVPIEQHPSATSFDGEADIMVSKIFSVGVTTNTTIENLQFARCGAIIKLVFSGKAAEQQAKLANQHPVSVSLTSASDLVGNVLFDYENGTAYISSSASKTVSASYTNSTHYLIDGTNATYLIVVPTTLSGTLEVEAITEDYEISRSLTLPDDIILEAGKVYTFNVKFGDASITDATPAQALPWSNDFSWHSSAEETNYTTDVATHSSGEFTGGAYIYGAKEEAGAIRIGNSSNPGSITTKLMNLAGAFKVTVSAKAYNASDGSKITVTVGDVTKTADATLGSAYSDYVFNFDAGDGTAKSSLTIGTDQKRAVITSVSVESSIPQVATPTFSPVAGEVASGTEVTISTTTEGATIYYTTDGSEPTTSSTQGNTVTITAITTVKAIAVKDGMANSEVAEASYTIAGQAPTTGWIETSLANIASTDVFVIVGNNGSTYAMSNDNGTGSAPSAVAVTVSGSVLKGTIADNIKWKVSGNATDGYTFYPNGSTTKWLYCTSTNNGVRVGTNNDRTFTISENGYLKHVETSRFVGIYNSSDWRCYTSEGGNIAKQTFKFYKYTNSSSGDDPTPTTLIDVLDLDLTGVSGTSYTDWSGKTSNSDAVYAGNSAGGNSSIQLRSSNSNSGIVTTTSGGKVKKIVVTWNSNTADARSIDIYGSNTAYSAASDLYNSSKQGTLIGSIANGSTELTVTEDYAYFGIRSYSGALYLDKVEITWK